MSPADPAGLAETIRLAFDRSFAALPRAGVVRGEDLLLVHVGDAVLGLRLTHVASVHAGVPVVPVPTTQPERLGVSAVRGTLLAVVGLREVLGCPPGPFRADPAADRRSWIAVAAGEDRLAFAFDAFLGHVRLGSGDLAPVDARPGGRWVREVARWRDTSVPVLDLPGLVAGLGDRSPANPSKETRA